MSDKTRDNPAWRLYDVIERGMAARNGTIRDFWAAAFDVPAKDVAGVFRGLSLLHTLVDEVEAEVRLLSDVDHSYYLQNLPSIRAAISSTNLDKAANEIVSLLYGITHRDVGFWANQIPGDRFPERLKNDEIRSLLAEIDALFEDVRKAGIDDDLKRVVLAALENIRRAVSEYWLRGSKGLREEVERAVASMGRYAADLQEEAKEPWFKRLWKMLRHVDEVAEKGKKYLPLVKSASKLLPPGTLPFD